MLLDMLLHRPDLTFDFYLLHKDPTLVERREEAMAAARMKMQEELDAKASIFREKQKLVEFVKKINQRRMIFCQYQMSTHCFYLICGQQEEEKRRHKIEMWESMQQGKSYKGAPKLSQVIFHLKHLYLCCSVLKSFL